MALTLSGTNGVVGAGFTLDASGASVTAGVGTFGNSLIGGHAKGNNDSSKLSVFDSSSNIGILQVHCGTETLGTLAGITFGQGGNTSTARAKSAIAAVGSGGFGRSDLCFYVDSVSDNNPVSVSDEKIRIMHNGKVGIGSTIPTTTLDVNGLIKSGAPSFSARRNTTQNLDTSTEAVIIFNSEDHDTDDAYNTSTGEFTVPSGKGGVYQINAHLGIDDVNSGFIVRLRVFKNGSQFYGMRSQNIGAATNSILTTHISATATLAAGDVIKCMGFHNDTEGAQPIEVDANGFSMFRLSI